MNANETLRQVRQYARAPYTDVGGYPLMLVMEDGEALCAKCAHDNYRLISEATRGHDRSGWEAAGVDVNWEDASLTCANCGAALPSAYGED